MQTSLKQIAAERGMDWKTLIDDVAEVNEYAKSKGVYFGAAGAANASTSEETVSVLNCRRMGWREQCNT